MIDFFEDYMYPKIAFILFVVFSGYYLLSDNSVKTPKEIAMFINKQNDDVRNCLKEDIYKKIENNNKIYLSNLESILELCNEKVKNQKTIKEIELNLKNS